MICEACNLSYSDFRTSFTYKDIYHLIYNRKHKRRHGVLGYWRQVKLAMWAEHKKGCDNGRKQNRGSEKRNRQIEY